MSAGKSSARVTLLLFGFICQGLLRAAEGDDEATMTGSYAIEATPLEVIGPDSAANFASVVPLDETVTWRITVPESYDHESAPGVLVYISPSNSGKLPRKWNKLPETHNLIWIAADDSGNRIAVAHRMTYTLFAILLLGDRYSIDSNRVYLCGFSGGARVAGLVAAAYPQVFKGDIYIGGAETWEGELASAKLQAMKQNRYVFLAGSEDFNRRMVRSVAAKYTAVGMEDIELRIVAHLGHDLPNASVMSDALNFLDAAAKQQRVTR